MNDSPFRQPPPPAPIEEPKAPDFHQPPATSMGVKIFGVVFSLYWVVTVVEVLRAGGAYALALCALWVALPLAGCVTYKHFAARIESWKARRVARDVARLMARDDVRWDPRATVRRY